MQVWYGCGLLCYSVYHSVMEECLLCASTLLHVSIVFTTYLHPSVVKHVHTWRRVWNIAYIQICPAATMSAVQSNYRVSDYCCTISCGLK